MVVKITSSVCLKKNKAVYFSIVLMPTCNNVNTCGRKLKRDKKQLIELEWPNKPLFSSPPLVLKLILVEGRGGTRGMVTKIKTFF